MLFQRLYNWIKYKTLPSSFLFKNRLFIERDSKHRRIFSNFGLNFRGSKWSTYDTYNIKSKSKISFSKYLNTLLIFSIICIFIFNYSKFYMTLNFFNNIAFFVWILIDSFDYYFSFLVWIITSLLSVFFNAVYSYFFFNNFSKRKDSRNFSSVVEKKFSANPGYLSSSKEDLNWVFYSWVTNSNSAQKPLLLESLFDTNVNKNWWLKFYDFFPALYGSIFSLNQVSRSTNVNFSHNPVSDKKTVFQFFNNERGILPYSDSIIYYYLTKNQKPSVNFFNFIEFSNQWGIKDLSFSNNENSFLLKNRNGLFVLDNLNYLKFNHMFSNFNEFWSLNFFIKNQIDGAKLNRWLYKYSTLHRKILKTSHKITMSKKLINTGFYENNLFNKNIWSAENISKFSNNNAIFNLVNLSYQNKFNSDTFYSKFNYSGLNNSNGKTKISFLSFYENSYFWFLKRNYLLNNLSSNFILSGLKKNENLSNHLLSKEINESILLDYYSSVSNLLASDINSISAVAKENFYSSFYRNLSEKTHLLPSTRDFQIIMNDLELMSRDNAALLSWITTVSTSTYSNNYLKYLSNTEYTFILNPKFYLRDARGTNDLSYYFFLNSTRLSRFYLNDVLYLNLFN